MTMMPNYGSLPSTHPAYAPVTEAGWISFAGLPPPIRAEMSFSGERDRAFVEATFDGIIPRDQVQRTHHLLYGGDPLWWLGADETHYSIKEGRPQTKIKFRVGPYRYSKTTQYNASYFLYEELLHQLEGLIDSQSVFRPSAASFSGNISSEFAFWRYTLSNGVDADQRPSLLELTRQIDRSAFMGEIKYDDVVRNLFDHWMILVRMDPNYLVAVNEFDLFLNPGNIPAPTFFIRNCLDRVNVWYTNNYAFPEVDDITFDVPLRMSLRENEDTMFQFWHDYRRPLPNTRRFYNNATGTYSVLSEGQQYWRFGDSLSNWRVGNYDDVPYWNARNPWTLWSPVLLPSIEHAHLESYIAQQVNFFPNRRRRVTAVAPLTADEVKGLLPGSPVKLPRYPDGSNLYWITEFRITTPPLTMELDLIYPGRPWDGDITNDIGAERAQSGISTTGPTPLTPPGGVP